MSVRSTVLEHYQVEVDHSADRVVVPPEGWIRTVRKALGMSGAQLARKMGVTRARIAQAEKAELDGGVTLKSMEAMAKAMGCRFAYAFVPPGTIENVLIQQAREKAIAIVDRAGVHMALEDQALSAPRREAEIARVMQDLLRDMPADLWDER